MKTTIEAINGQLCSVIWHCNEENKNKLPRPFEWFSLPSGSHILLVKENDGGANVYAIALPALPKHPTKDDAPLLCRYAAEGITTLLSADDTYQIHSMGLMSWQHDADYQITEDRVEIIGATDAEGNEVAVAIADCDGQLSNRGDSQQEVAINE